LIIFRPLVAGFEPERVNRARETHARASYQWLVEIDPLRSLTLPEGRRSRVAVRRRWSPHQQGVNDQQAQGEPASAFDSVCTGRQVVERAFRERRKPSRTSV
jgi:hypothetical protein